MMLDLPERATDGSQLPDAFLGALFCARRILEIAAEGGGAPGTQNGPLTDAQERLVLALLGLRSMASGLERAALFLGRGPPAVPVTATTSDCWWLEALR